MRFDDKPVDEIFAAMQQNLLIKTANDKAAESDVYQAAQYLSKAAALLDDAGLDKESEAVTVLLEKIANV